jgi:hypothetical protein
MSAVTEANASNAASASDSHSATPTVEKTTVIGEHPLQQQPSTPSTDVEGQVALHPENDTFGNEEGAEIQYKTCKWWYVKKPCPCINGTPKFKSEPDVSYKSTCSVLDKPPSC